MSDKLQIAIYCLNDYITISDKGNKTKKNKIDIQFLTKFFKSKRYSSQKLQPNLSENFEIKLYFKKDKTDIKWKDFIKKIAASNEPIIRVENTTNESYILLLRNIKSDKIYATTGGFGHTALQGLVSGDFGLDILSRIVKAEDKTLKSTKEKNLSGGVLGGTKYFRSNYNLNENENFGNFYQELNSSLNKKLLTSTFGFSQKEINSECLCVAKNSFTIKKSISLDQLIKIIENCEKLIREITPIVEINGVKKLNKADNNLISELELLLNNEILNLFSGVNNDFIIELCHKEFEKYLNADRYILKYRFNNKMQTTESNEPFQNIVQILDYIKSTHKKLQKKELFEILINANIESQTIDGVFLTKDLLRNHFSTEIRYKDKSYFLLDRDWFEIKPNFIQKLNEQCQSFIKANKFSTKLEAWNYSKENENDFNAKHLGKKNFLVFDKFTPENIEACDILHWDETCVYLIHVKAGFDNSMRDLSHQIFIAARKIKEDSKTGYSFIKKLYDEVKLTEGTSEYYKNAKKHLKKISESVFISLFKDKKIVFVLAVFDTAKKQRDINNVELFHSNIAKFSLHELVKNMRNLAIEFRITKI